MPILRLPMHSTFVLTAGQALFDAGLALAKARHVPLNYLLHAADVIDAVPDPALASYRFLAAPWSEKQALYEHMLRRLSQEYHLMPTAELIQRQPDFMLRSVSAKSPSAPPPGCFAGASAPCESRAGPAQHDRM